MASLSSVDRSPAWIGAAGPYDVVPDKVWHVGRQAVIRGDCLDILPTLKDASVDVVVSSPPYNIGTAYRSYVDRRPRAEYLDWLAEVAKQLARVMTSEASLFLNVGGTGTDPWVAMDVANVFREMFYLQNHIVWVKSISIGTDTFGHFKPITSPRFLNNTHESLFHFSSSGKVPVDRLAVGAPYKDKSNLSRWRHAKGDLRCAGNTWFIPYETTRSPRKKFNHPAGFPVALPERCIELHSVPGATVLDPFVGTGTTLVAASRLGCAGIGIELDPTYAKAAVTRLRAEPP